MPVESLSVDWAGGMSNRLWFTSNPRAFLATGGGHLQADPVLCTVLASTAHREAVTGRESPVGAPHWYLVVYDSSNAVVGVAMRTASRPPHALFVLPMPDQAAIHLARVLHRRGEPVGGVNGALPTSQLVAVETSRLTGGTVEVAMPTRLYELRRLIEPPPVPGALRAATSADLELVVDWVSRFHVDAERQAGRTPTVEAEPDPRLTASRIDAGHYWLWRVNGQDVHLSGLSPASFGAQRISFVYTPAEFRGQGWAGAAVAHLSRRILVSGVRPCLYTDQNNPVSNHLYTTLGFEPIVDMANLTINPSR